MLPSTTKVAKDLDSTVPAPTLFDQLLPLGWLHRTLRTTIHPLGVLCPSRFAQKVPDLLEVNPPTFAETPLAPIGIRDRYTEL